MRTRALLIVAATVGVAVASGTAAVAGPPPICPGVVEKAPQQYKLTSDTSCSLGLFGSGSTVNLAGWTLTTGTSTVVLASDLTVRNGKLRGSEIYWGGAQGTLQSVDMAPTPGGGGRLIKVAGAGFSATKSTFHDATEALDLYLVGQATITDSTFRANSIAVAVQQNDHFTITGSTFAGNQTGLLLWDEDGFGVNDVVVDDNVFRNNLGAGIQVRLTKDAHYAGARTLDDVQITGNRLVRNGGPGLDVTVTCSAASDCASGTSSIAVSGNTLERNGFAPPAGLGNDGISARTLVAGTADTVGLSVVRLTNNVARGNADRGIDAAGVTDGGGNSAHGNTNPAQCTGVVCS